MKAFTILMMVTFIISANLMSQEFKYTCDELIQKSYDDMTNEHTITNKIPIYINYPGSDDMINISIYQSGSGALLIINYEGASPCVDKGSKINFLFDNAERLEISNVNQYNCKQTVMFYLGYHSNPEFMAYDELLMFKKLNVKKIRVWGHDDYVELKLSTRLSETLRQSIKCISEYE
jgi:hypothetical protein